MHETIVSAAEGIRSGQRTASQLVEQCLSRIRQHEDRICAWVMIDEAGATAAAAEMDREAARGGFRGPLHGIPLAIKDIVDVAGWPTLAGSRLRAGHVAQADAEIVRRLRGAGAIILGKTVTTEFASFDPPPTRNPWNLDRTPGGSSSGSAAAVAMEMCLGAIGSQTGGSITRPASYCGVAGCKPTYGRVCLDGIVPLAPSMDHPGPIAHSSADLATLLAVIADDASLKMVPRSQPPRLGLLEGYFHEHASPDVQRSMLQAVAALCSAGAQIVQATLSSDIEDVRQRHRRVMAVEAAEYHRPWFPSRRAEYGQWIAALLDEGWSATAIDYAAARRRQAEFRQDVLQAMRHVDALILPSTTTPAPGLDSTGDPRFNSLWSYCGLPTVTIPCGVSDDGLPLGLQFVGRPDSEGELLGVTDWCERPINFERTP